MADRERPSARTPAQPPESTRRSSKIVSWRLQNMVGCISNLESTGPSALHRECFISNRRMPRSGLFPGESKRVETVSDFLPWRDSRRFLLDVTARYRPKRAPVVRVWAAKGLAGQARSSYRRQRKQNQKGRGAP